MNGIALAASLKSSGLSSKELEKGKFTKQSVTNIKQQLNILKMNKLKSHHEITDNIYEREAHRYEDMYQKFLAEKKADENRGEIS